MNAMDNNNFTVPSENRGASVRLLPFAQMVLDTINPDPALREDILHPQPLRPVCDAECMEAFRERMEIAAEAGEKIMIAGDYDCDGMMATAIMRQGLSQMGLETGYSIPDRLKEGYGLSERTVQLAADKGYSLIITVDNGVSAHAALEKAKELDVEVIVTDHHLYEVEPDCSLLVHPRTMGFPFEELCGAAIAFECMRALGQNDRRFLIWAAIASISDCMRVANETRSIIQQGLAELNRAGEMHINPFVRQYPINEEDVSFQIAPRVNAIGRLSERANPNTFVRYLETTAPEPVAKYAAQVSEINELRKDMTQDLYARALVDVNPLDSIIFISNPAFHEGIVGLAAGRLSSRTEKPVIMATPNGDILKCSMRGQPGFHCLNFLKEYDGFTALGGHAQAAGFSLPIEKEEEFRKFLRRQIALHPAPPVIKPHILIAPEQVTVDNVLSLDALRPFGTGFKLPDFEIDHPFIMRTYDMSQGRHRKFTLEKNVQAIHFNQTSTDRAAKPDQIEKLIGTLSVSTYNGRRSADFLVDEIVYTR